MMNDFKWAVIILIAMMIRRCEGLGIADFYYVPESGTDKGSVNFPYLDSFHANCQIETILHASCNDSFHRIEEALSSSKDAYSIFES